jgi:hypothetical protein
VLAEKGTLTLESEKDFSQPHLWRDLNIARPPETGKHGASINTRLGFILKSGGRGSG